MIGDYETTKLATLSALFVVLVVAAVVIGARDAKRHRIEHERRVRQQVELLKRARAEAERHRRLEMQAGNVDLENGGFRPSEFVSMDMSPQLTDRPDHGVGHAHGGGSGTFNAA